MYFRFNSYSQCTIHFTIQTETVSNLNNKILVLTSILISTWDRNIYVSTGRIIYSGGPQ